MAGSTPIYGFPYPQSTDLVADYPTLGQELATDVETVISGLGSGLNIITPTSIANSGGTATASGGAITFTGVSSVSLNGCFTTTYDNYVALLSLGASADVLVRFRLRLAGTDASGADYGMAYLNPASGTATETSGYLTYPSTAKAAAQLHLHGPKLAEITPWNVFGGNYSQFMFASGRHNVATAYDGITIYPASGTITGKLRVYGYKNS